MHVRCAVVGRVPSARFFQVLPVLLAVVFWVSRPAPAQVVNSSWSAGAAGGWFTSSNWTPAAVPNNGAPAGTSYSVAIAQPTGVNVSLNGNATINSLNLSATTGKLTVLSGVGLTSVTLLLLGLASAACRRRRRRHAGYAEAPPRGSTLCL